MKNLKLLLILGVGMLIFQSCNKDDEGTQEADLIGIWGIDNLDFDILINNQSLSEFLGDDSGQFEALFTAELEAEFENSTFEFKSDNTYEVIQPGEPTETGTWSINVEGNELRFDEGTPDETIFKIKSITNTSLILNIEESDDSQDLDGDGTADKIKIIVDLYLSK